MLQTIGRRSFLLFAAFIVLALLGLRKWPHLKEIKRLRANGEWERVRMYELRRGDVIEVADDSTFYADVNGEPEFIWREASWMIVCAMRPKPVS